MQVVRVRARLIGEAFKLFIAGSVWLALRDKIYNVWGAWASLIDVLVLVYAIYVFRPYLSSVMKAFSSFSK